MAFGGKLAGQHRADLAVACNDNLHTILHPFFRAYRSTKEPVFKDSEKTGKHESAEADAPADTYYNTFLSKLKLKLTQRFFFRPPAITAITAARAAAAMS